MKKLLFIIYVLLFCIHCNAQVTVKSSQLIGTKWTIDGGGKVGEDTLTFYKDYQLNVAYYNLVKRTTKFTTPYYLSESIPKIFDHSKVGTSTSGCFLIEYNNKLKRMSISQIRSFDLKKGELVFYNPYIKDAIRDGTIKFRLISKKKEDSLKDDTTKAEEPATASQEAEPEEEVPVNPAEAVISSLKQITPEISKIIEELDGGGNIIVDESQRTRYDSQNKQICIGAEPTDEKVLHAIIHYIQDTQDELSYENNSVNNEFEASWLTFLTYFIRYGVFNDKVTLGLSSNENREMEEYLIKSLSGNCTINSCFYDFMDQYMTNDHLDKFSEEKRQSLNNDSSRDGYWHSRDYDYEYNWLQKLEMLGFKYSN